MTFYDYCMRNGMEELLGQWDNERNEGLSPENISYGSKASVWWICGKGHSWKAIVKARCAGSGCPVCAGKKVLQGVNDLSTTHPALAAQWHPAKNGGLLPTEVVAGTHRKVWWRCDKGHKWQASISSRSRGIGCPVCAGKVSAKRVNRYAAMMLDTAEVKRNGAVFAKL